VRYLLHIAFVIAPEEAVVPKSRRLFWNNRPTAIRQKKGERLRERETLNLSPNLI